jgi:hypothetical protein
LVESSLVLLEESSLVLLEDSSLVLVKDYSLVLVVDYSLVMVEATYDQDMVLAMATVLEESMALVAFVEETVSLDIKKNKFICLAVLNK